MILKRGFTLDKELELKEKTKQIIGKTIRAKRTKIGMTLEELSESANLDTSFIGAVERGKKNITTFTLYKIAAGLGLNNPHELLMDATHTIYPDFIDLANKKE
jgi:transcriptional regulator with XRE-family HTH domain